MTERNKMKTYFECYFCKKALPASAAECEHLLACGCSYAWLQCPTPWCPMPRVGVGGPLYEYLFFTSALIGGTTTIEAIHPLADECEKLWRKKAVAHLQKAQLRRDADLHTKVAAEMMAPQLPEGLTWQKAQKLCGDPWPQKRRIKVRGGRPQSQTREP